MSEELKKQYEIGPQIGRGRFGIVYRCVSAENGGEFAVKSIEKALLADAVDRECIEREAEISLLVTAGNPHAVQVQAVFEDEEWLHVIMELCPGPDLFDRIRERGTPLAEAEAAAVMAQLMKAVAVCHRRGVAHRDIKPDNVMFDVQARLKLTDFGSAEYFGDGRPMRGLVGTPYYVAPEVVAGRDYNEKVDVWSAGVVLYILLAGIPPFHGDTAVEIFEAVLRANLRFPTRIFGSVSPAAKDLLRRMLCKDVSRRFSAEQVLSKPSISSSSDRSPFLA